MPDAAAKIPARRARFNTGAGDTYAKVAHDEPHAGAPHEHLSPWPLFMGFSVMLLYYGVLFRGPILGVGILLFLASIYGWVFEDYRHWKTGELPHDEGHAEPDDSLLKKFIAKPGAWWGVVVFLLTEIMLFGGLFALYFNAKAGLSTWPPTGAPELPLFTTGVNTVILVSSGFTMHVGIMFLKRNNRRWFLALFAATIFLGGWFLYNQVTEYLELMVEGFTLDNPEWGTYSASFYALTGIHGAHVTAGLAGLTAVFARGVMGQWDAKRHLGIEGVAIYWHFVDVVWIFLYLVIYVRIIG